MGFSQLRLSSLFCLGIAEVVGSNPTRSISFILVDYGIVLRLILIIVGQKPLQQRSSLMQWGHAMDEGLALPSEGKAATAIESYFHTRQAYD
ncbi:MAG: hypothetical protein ACJ71P_03300 [Nitrososphaeraceae archaeon]